MIVAATRTATGGRGARPWRLLVIIALVAACALLAVPGVAGAHVKAKYRTEYKAKLTGYDKSFTIFAIAYDNLSASSASHAETVAPWIGDPAMAEQLQIWEDAARAIYEGCKDSPMQTSMKFSKSIKAFKGKAKRYFATATQQRLFKKRCDLLKAYASYLMWLANDHVYDSYRLLGMHPPNLQASAEALADGDADAATGHEGWDKQYAALRGML